MAGITARQDVQIGGINESVKYPQGLLESEIARRSGEASDSFLGGRKKGRGKNKDMVRIIESSKKISLILDS